MPPSMPFRLRADEKEFSEQLSGIKKSISDITEEVFQTQYQLLRLLVHGDDFLGVGFHSSYIVVLETLLSCIMNFKLWKHNKTYNVTGPLQSQIRHILDPKHLLKKRP